VCHDASSLLAVQFPFAAPRPTTCDKPAIISPLTSLLVYGGSKGLTAPVLLSALSLPSDYALLTTDSLIVSWVAGCLGGAGWAGAG